MPLSSTLGKHFLRCFDLMMNVYILILVHLVSSRQRWAMRALA